MSDPILDTTVVPEDVSIKEAPVVLPPAVEPAMGNFIHVLMGYDAEGGMIVGRQPVSSLVAIVNQHGHPLREVAVSHGLTFIHTADLPDGTWVYAAEDAGAR